MAAVLNQIHGRNHDGTTSPGIPTVFGMNFQAVSVGQKLAKDNYDGSCVPVATSQVAPTILRSLGLDPAALRSVQVEHTPALPGLSE